MTLATQNRRDAQLTTSRKPLSSSWKRAIGLLSRHKKALEKHARIVRKEWTR